MDNVPIWSPDGERVVFASRRTDDRLGFFSKRADGTGPVEPLLMSEWGAPFRPYGWSLDGTTLVFGYANEVSDLNVGLLSMDGDRPWEPLLDTDANETEPAVSPNGEWLAYASDQTGQFEVYVERFPDLGDRRQVSTNGGQMPKCSSDGGELFYRVYRGRNDRAMMVVDVVTEPTFAPGLPEQLFDGAYLLRYDVAPDGQRFLMTGEAALADGGTPTQLVLVLNWFTELERLVPTPLTRAHRPRHQDRLLRDPSAPGRRRHGRSLSGPRPHAPAHGRHQGAGQAGRRVNSIHQIVATCVLTGLCIAVAALGVVGAQELGAARGAGTRCGQRNPNQR